MSILQQQPSNPASSSQIVAASLDPPKDLEYPQALTPLKNGNFAMPLILWGLGLLLGILIFLVHLPMNPPPFDQLTHYTCDALPPLPNLGNRYQRYSLNLRCRTGDQVIYQRTNLIPHSNQAATNACMKEGSQTQIWRMDPSSPYGSYVFQVTCGDLSITNYKSRAASYETTQRFVIAFGSLITLLSAIGVAVSLIRFHAALRIADK